MAGSSSASERTTPTSLGSLTATRVEPRTWAKRDLAVSRSGQGDGFDMAQDGERFYVTFAGNNSPEVELFTREKGATPGSWIRRDGLQAPNPQAAMGRGLRADTAGSAYLVHRNENVGTYGIARYDLGIDRWPQRGYMETFTDVFVHSLFVTADFRLCMSGDYRGDLLVTCGTIFDLEQRARRFGTERLAPRHPSSLIEGDDGTLYIAYNPVGNDELRVARLAPGADFQSGWEIITVFDGPSFGVSTALDLNGKLAISFYTCDLSDLCSLKLVLEDPSSL